MNTAFKIIMWLITIIGCGYTIGMMITIIVDTIIDLEDWKRNRRNKK